MRGKYCYAVWYRGHWESTEMDRLEECVEEGYEPKTVSITGQSNRRQNDNNQHTCELQKRKRTVKTKHSTTLQRTTGRKAMCKNNQNTLPVPT